MDSGTFERSANCDQRNSLVVFQECVKHVKKNLETLFSEERNNLARRLVGEWEFPTQGKVMMRTVVNPKSLNAVIMARQPFRIWIVYVSSGEFSHKCICFLIFLCFLVCSLLLLLFCLSAYFYFMFSLVRFFQFFCTRIDCCFSSLTICRKLFINNYRVGAWHD